eukprot:2542286-Pyramimonas_sp.AAC.2
MALNWRQYAELWYVSASVDMLAVQLNLLVALSNPRNQADQSPSREPCLALSGTRAPPRTRYLQCSSRPAQRPLRSGRVCVHCTAGEARRQEVLTSATRTSAMTRGVDHATGAAGGASSVTAAKGL